MRPKDLKPLCSWEERRPLFEKPLFYVPPLYDKYDDFLFPSWEEIFGNAYPVFLEYCSGNGSWIVERAKQERHANFVAVEMRFDRIRKLVSKCHNHNLTNLLIVWAEALTFTRHYLPFECLSKVFVNFPDPWPKRRHEKNRLMAPPFISEIKRVLKKGGEIIFVTDDKPYLECALTLLQSTFVPRLPSPFYTPCPQDYGTSFFDTLWRDKGKTIYYAHYEK